MADMLDGSITEIRPRPTYRSTPDLLDRFIFKPMTDDQQDTAQVIRNCYMTLADLVDREIKAPREKALAITNLENSLMWAIKGLSR